MVVSRTAISELAKGNHELEAKGVGLLMSMVGYGMLISPALGGVLSEPLKQYPNSTIFQPFESLLSKYPFLLPNIIAFVFSMVSMIFVIVTVEETLPIEKRRHWKYVGLDSFYCLRKLLCFCCCCKSGGENTTATHDGANSSTQRISSTETTGGSAIASTTPDNNYNSDNTYEDVDEGIDDEDDWEEDIKLLETGEFEAMSILASTSNARASFSSALHRASIVSHLTEDEQDPQRYRESFASAQRCHKRPSSIVSAASPQHQPRDSATTVYYDPDDETTPLTTSIETKQQHDVTASSTNTRVDNSIQGIWSNTTTRAYLISFWINSFTSVCQSETFPLYAMSKKGGLSMEESSIGAVGATSGMIYCIMQYFVFTQAMKHFGLVQTLRLGSLGCGIPVILIPFSMFLNGSIQILYISFVSGIVSVSFSVFAGCNTIGGNRSVDPSQRAAMNGVSGMGVALARGIGPIFAGSLVTFGLTSGVVAPEFGGWFIYIIVAMVGIFSYRSSLLVPEEDEDDVDEVEHKQEDHDLLLQEQEQEETA